jgi:hypothetical protein
VLLATSTNAYPRVVVVVVGATVVVVGLKVVVVGAAVVVVVVGAAVVVVAIHPNAPCEVNVYKGPPGNVVVLPIMITVLVGKPLATAVHLSLDANVPGAYAIEYAVELFAQSNIL